MYVIAGGSGGVCMHVTADGCGGSMYACYNRW